MNPNAPSIVYEVERDPHDNVVVAVSVHIPPAAHIDAQGIVWIFTGEYVEDLPVGAREYYG